MGLKDTFKNAATTIFNAAGDVPVDATYYVNNSTVYDVSAGVASMTSRAHLVSGIFSRYKKSEIDNTHVRPTDLKMLILQTDITDTPTTKDKVGRIEANVSVVYQVVDYEQDPVGATWMIQLRRP